MVLELHGGVVPEPLHLSLGPDPRRFGLADRTHPPAAVPRTPPVIRRHLEALVVELDPSVPASGLGEPHRVEHRTTVHPLELAGLLVGRDRTGPVEIERQPVPGFLRCAGRACDAQLLQRPDHLDRQRADRGVHPIPELAGRSHDAVGVPPYQAGERILDRQVRILPETEYQKCLAVVAVAVEVVPVIEVAVAGDRMANGLRALVNGIVVEGRE